jgi:trehalose 2-sulfotransferase
VLFFCLGLCRVLPYKAVMVSAFAPELLYAARLAALRQVFPDHERQWRTVLDRSTHREGIGRRPTGRGYLLCITPCSGSSMLADVLAKTGSVGMALEHFSAENASAPEWMANCVDLNDFLAALERAAPDGYFGIKGTLFQMFPLISEGVFAGPGCIFKHIYLTRRDQLGQAISLARAVKTNEWHSHDKPAPDPELSIESVLSFLRYLRKMEADWETVFTALQLKPLRVCYEDLVANAAGIFGQIGQYLDVQWKVDPAGIVSAYESLSSRHDPLWIQKLRARFETPPGS